MSKHTDSAINTAMLCHAVKQTVSAVKSLKTTDSITTNIDNMVVNSVSNSFKKVTGDTK